MTPLLALFSAAPLGRLWALLSSRRASYDALRAAVSAEEARRWASQHSLLGFNREVLRTAIVAALARAQGATVFVETGTYHAATAVCARRLLELPVETCEVIGSNAAIARIVTLGLGGIRIRRESSPEFLRRLCGTALRQARPFFYLDAHCEAAGGESFPLLAELAAVLALENFAVMIDDFQVPGGSPFGFDTYNGQPISLGYIAAALAAGGIERVWFPDYDPSAETGFRRGWCAFWRSPPLDAAAQSGGFPFSLLKACDLPRAQH